MENPLVLSEGDFEYATAKQCVVIVKYKGSAEHLAIPDKIKGLPVGFIWNDAFYCCENLISVTIPDRVLCIGDNVFFGCIGLNSVSIPNSVVKIGSNVFYNCVSLSRVAIPKSVAEIGYNAFSDCTGLTSITVDPDNSNFTGVNGVLFDKPMKTLIKYPEGKIGEYTIPDSVAEIGDYAFSGCTGLNSVSIPDSVVKIGDSAFSDCTGLNSITIPDSVTEIGKDAFEKCSELTSITISESVTEIGKDAFAGCDRLTDITVDAQNSGYTSVNGVLFDKQMKILLHYPKEKSGAYTIPDSVAEIGDRVFSDCIGLTSVDIPNSITKIGHWAFSGCTGLNSVSIPNSVVKIGDSAFYGCTGLNSITIPDSVVKIGDTAFYGCENLTSVTIPDSVTEIGHWAFHNCENLNSITIPKSVLEIGKDAFEDAEYIHCPMTTVLTAYGNSEKIDRIAVRVFDNPDSRISKEGQAYCAEVNRRNFRENPWVSARIVSRGVDYPLDFFLPLKFEALAELDDKAVQKTLREVDAENLAKALKGAAEALQEKVFLNMSKRAAGILREDMEVMGSVAPEDIAEAQEMIIKIILHLAETGQIVLPFLGEIVL
jgi:hypothetical protein